MSICENIKAVRAQIREAALAAGRDPDSIALCAATKMNDADKVRQAIAAGVDCCGENRVQELTQKLSENAYTGAPVHFIGHLQTNKVKQTVKTFDYIHSVDSIKLAQCINQHAKEIGKVQNILLQINNANEEQKFGLSKDEIFEYFGPIKQLDGICIKGVMNVAPLGISEFEIGRLFTEIIEIRDELEKRFDCNLEEISMGMSQDYVIAAQKGSTMLRVGRKLFK